MAQNSFGDPTPQELVALNKGSYGAVTATGTVGPIPSGGNLVRRKSILIVNPHNNEDVFIGTDGSVITANGLPILPGATVQIDIDEAVTLYIISDGTSVDVRYMELGYDYAG